jgi:hypothetical protein
VLCDCSYPEYLEAHRRSASSARAPAVTPATGSRRHQARRRRQSSDAMGSRVDAACDPRSLQLRRTYRWVAAHAHRQRLRDRIRTSGGIDAGSPPTACEKILRRDSCSGSG